MTPDYYQEYLQHELTQAEAKKIFDEWLVDTKFNGEHHDLQGTIDHIEKKVAAAFTIPADRLIPAARLGVADRLFEKMISKEVKEAENAADGPWRTSVKAAAAEVAAATAENKPLKIRLIDIRDFSNG